MFDLSDHEDADEIIDFPDRGCRDPFTPILNHAHVSIAVDFSKPPLYYDLSNDEVETSQIVKALMPELMVMSGPHFHEVGFTSNQEIVQTPEAPQHSSICTEDKSHTHNMLPPLKLHDPITHALVESYIASTRA